MATLPTKSVILAPRAKSSSSSGNKVQRRTLKSDVPRPTVYKTKSDTNLADRLQNLSLQNGTTNNVRHVGSAGQRGYHTLQDIAHHIHTKQTKNIVVMAGAGISTPSGIPDFRTPGTGLYDNLKQYRIPQPESIFDIEYFDRNPRPFYTLARELYPTGQFRPNYVHYFLKLLHMKGILLRVYTQNIDGLERSIPAQKLVEAHGSFQSASCVKCRQPHPIDPVREDIINSKMPRCQKDGCSGLVKPDIVFFGQDLPKRFYYYLRDFPQADLLIVMGTSLEVEPFASIVDSGRIYVPRVLFNREAVPPFDRKRRMNDMVVEGDIVAGVFALVQSLGWKEDMENLLMESEPDMILPDEYEVDSLIRVYAPLEKSSTPKSNRRRKIPLVRSFLPSRRNARKPSEDSETTSSESSEDSSSESSTSSSSDDVPRRNRARVKKFVRRMPINRAFTRANSSASTASSPAAIRLRRNVTQTPKPGNESGSSSNTSHPDSASSSKTTSSTNSKVASQITRIKRVLESNSGMLQKNSDVTSLSSASTNSMSKKRTGTLPKTGTNPESSSQTKSVGQKVRKESSSRSNPRQKLKQGSETLTSLFKSPSQTSLASLSRTPSQTSLTKSPSPSTPTKPPKGSLLDKKLEKPPIQRPGNLHSTRHQQTVSAHPHLQTFSQVPLMCSATVKTNKPDIPNHLPKISYRHRLQHFANPRSQLESSLDISMDDSSESLEDS